MLPNSLLLLGCPSPSWSAVSAGIHVVVCACPTQEYPPEPNKGGSVGACLGEFAGVDSTYNTRSGGETHVGMQSALLKSHLGNHTAQPAHAGITCCEPCEPPLCLDGTASAVPMPPPAAPRIIDIEIENLTPRGSAMTGAITVCCMRKHWSHAGVVSQGCEQAGVSCMLWACRMRGTEDQTSCGLVPTLEDDHTTAQAIIAIPAPMQVPPPLIYPDVPFGRRRLQTVDDADASNGAAAGAVFEVSHHSPRCLHCVCRVTPFDASKCKSWYMHVQLASASWSSLHSCEVL